MTYDPYRAGQTAYAAGMNPPSMKPNGMSAKEWDDWLRGWHDAMQAHADKEMEELRRSSPASEGGA